MHSGRLVRSFCYRPDRLLYRGLQKLAVLEIARTLTASTDQLSTGTEGGLVARLDRARVLGFFERGDAPSCEAFARRLDEPRLHCFGAIDAGRLLSFAWVHEGSAEAGMNFGYHPGTATAMRLTPDAAFVFHLHTAREARGRGLASAVLRHAAAALRAERGVRSLVTTTEMVNDAARLALKRAGFEDRGCYWRFGFGSWATGWYPPPSGPIVGFG